MVVPVLGGRNGNSTQANTQQSSDVVPVLQGRSNVVPVHTQASSLSIQKPQQQPNFLQQSGNFLSGVWNGAVGEVGSILHSQSQPKVTTPKFQATQSPKLPMGMQLTLTSPQLNQSAQTKTTQQSLNKQQQTSKTLTNVAKSVGKTFPQTSQLLNELSLDPANFKANPKKTLTDAVNTFKESWQQESTAFNDLLNHKNDSVSKKIGKQAHYVSSSANLAFSPLSALFNAAGDVPVLGSVSKLFTLGFTSLGEGATAVSNKIVDALPISQKAKNNIKPGLGEIAALAAQLATGKITEIPAKTRFQLIAKYGTEDAKVIVDKAQEIAKTKIVEPGTHTPQELRNQVFQKGIETTPHGKEMLKTSLQAEQQGQHVTISPPTLTKFDTPEVLKAREEQQQFQSTHTDTTPERVQLRKQIEDKLYGTGAKNKNKRLDIVMGLPAAGKSTTLAEPLIKQHGSLLIDADQVKAQLPEFQGGKGAMSTHIESSDVAEKGLLKRAAKNGDNIVLPLVGKNLEKMQSYVDNFKQLGYDVHLHLNDVNPETAAKRAVDRFQKTGRFVDPHYILNDVGLKPRKNYDILKMRKDITSYGKYSNEGESPQFLEGSSNYEQPIRSGSDQGTQHQSNIERANSGTETSKEITSKEKPLTPVGTGETKQSTLGRKVEAKAIENKLLKDGIDKLPEYQTANMKEQAKLASDYLASNEKDATDVALGRKSAPDGIIPEAIYTAVENKAITDKNVSLLANLAKSSRVGEATAMGQRIRTLGERNPDSPVKNITDLLNRKIKSVEDRTGKPIEKLREEEVTKIKKVQGEIKKPDKYDWSSFISSIQC